MSRCPGIVLTGGASRRMGTDKAFVLVDGRPMAIAVADALWEAGCHPVECQGGDLPGLASLGLEGFADDEAAAGPVAAIRTASARHDEAIMAVACDLPWIDAETIGAVVDAGAAADRPAVAVADGRHHLAVFVPAGSFDGAGADSSLHQVLDGAIEVAVDPQTVRNVNTAEDLRHHGDGR